MFLYFISVLQQLEQPLGQLVQLLLIARNGSSPPSFIQQPSLAPESNIVRPVDSKSLPPVDPSLCCQATHIQRLCCQATHIQLIVLLGNQYLADCVAVNVFICSGQGFYEFLQVFNPISFNYQYILFFFIIYYYRVCKRELLLKCFMKLFFKALFFKFLPQFLTLLNQLALFYDDVFNEDKVVLCFQGLSLCLISYCRARLTPKSLNPAPNP